MGVIHIFSGMSDINFYTERPQSLRCLGILQIGAGHLVTQVMEHLGDPGHPDPAYADKVYNPVSFKHGYPLQ